MAYVTVETIECDRCGLRIPRDLEMTVAFCLPTLALMERLTRQVVALGWRYEPAMAHWGKPARPARHYCPDCAGKRRPLSS